MIWLWDNAMTLSTLVMAAAAIVALIYAHLQSPRTRRRLAPMPMWALRLAFDNPKLSDPRLKLAQFDYEDHHRRQHRALFQKYELYVDTILQR